MDGQVRSENKLTSLILMMDSPRIVYDPEETEIDDWMLYIPHRYWIENGVACCIKTYRRV